MVNIWVAGRRPNPLHSRDKWTFKRLLKPLYAGLNTEAPKVPGRLRVLLGFHLGLNRKGEQRKGTGP